MVSGVSPPATPAVPATGTAAAWVEKQASANGRLASEENVREDQFRASRALAQGDSGLRVSPLASHPIQTEELRQYRLKDVVALVSVPGRMGHAEWDVHFGRSLRRRHALTPIAASDREVS